MASVEESDVGILCYVSEYPGFRGILKQRYSDFIVNEVDLDGHVVHLTSLEVPLEIVEEKSEKISDILHKDHSQDIESFRDLAIDSDVEMVRSFVDQIVSGVQSNDDCIVLSPSSDKVHRTAVHNFFKDRLKFLVTDTIDGPDGLSKCIRVHFKSGSNNGRGNSRKRKDRGVKPFDRRGSDVWPDNIGKFLRFNLYKENKDTMEALGLLGKMLGVQPRSFGFAGTKDKRSVSTQRVTIFKQRARKLAVLNEKLIGVKVGDFCYVHDGLVLGQLRGNQFTITLRSVCAENMDIIKESAAALGNTGFINYFGLQRFGNSSIPTHAIGAALLRGEWEAAVALILDPRDGEKDATRKVREYYKETRDIGGTLKQLPYHMSAERAVLNCLQRFPRNYLQALLSIPRTLRMMYVHSYQSFLWNHAASMRVEKYGVNQVALGDLVYREEQVSREKIDSFDFECEDDGNDGNDADLHKHPDDDASVIDHSEAADTPVKAISEEDITGGRYTIYDVVLPLPGSKIVYPSNDIQDVYSLLAEKDSISLTDCAHNSREFSLKHMSGAYRKVFQKPKDYVWEVVRYSDEKVALAETDWEMIKSKPHGEAEAEMKRKKHDDDDDDDDDDEESEMALKLSFILPPSSYATMAIRELLKSSTSVAHHTGLSVCGGREGTM